MNNTGIPNLSGGSGVPGSGGGGASPNEKVISNSELEEPSNKVSFNDRNNYDFRRTNNAFSLAGLGWGVNELVYYNKNFWLGKNLKYYSTLTWKYGNQWTGTSFDALKIAKPSILLGKISFGVNLIYGGYGVYSGISRGNYSKAVFSGLGTIYSGIATFGRVPQMIIAGPMVMIDATIGLDNYLQLQINNGIDRSNRISNGDYSLLFYPSFGQSVK